MPSLFKIYNPGTKNRVANQQQAAVCRHYLCALYKHITHGFQISFVKCRHDSSPSRLPCFEISRDQTLAHNWLQDLSQDAFIIVKCIFLSRRTHNYQLLLLCCYCYLCSKPFSAKTFRYRWVDNLV